MRLVFLAGRYWPAIGGVERLVHHVANALAQRHEVTVIAHHIDDDPPDRLSESLRHPPPFAPFDDGNVRVVPVVLPTGVRLRLLPLGIQVVPIARRYAFGPMRVALSEWSSQVMSRVLAPHVRGADILHVWAADLIAANGVGAARRAGVPVVITPFVHPGQWGYDPGSIRSYRRADHIVGLLNVERKVFIELGVPTERVTVCGSCTPGVTTGGGTALRRSLGISGPLVLFLGARRPYKGHDLLLATAAELRSSLPDAVFAFVGPGDPLSSERLGHNVVDGGVVDDEGRGAWLDAADLLCLPSAHEIFPLSLLEAFSARTPALVSDLPPLRELMTRSGGGRVVGRTVPAITQALHEMLGDPVALRRMGEAGHAFWAEQFTPEALARCHERIYERIVDDRRSHLGESRVPP